MKQFDNFEDLQTKINELKLKQNIEQNAEYHKSGFLKVLYKKIVKKVFLNWYMNPFVSRQSNFNKKNTEIIDDFLIIIKNYEQEINKRIDENDRINQQLQESLIRLENDEKIIKQLSTLYERIEEDEKIIKQLSFLFERIESDENTIIELSKSASRIDGDERTIIQLSNKLDLIENNNNLLKNHAENVDKKLSIMDNMGIDLFRTKEFNMLDKNTNSQAGEDSILAYIVAVLGIPFVECSYVDLGANHPKEMSNTYFFYSHGAKGVLVEANPQLIPELKFYRNRDVILNRCVDVRSGEFVEFNIMNVDGLSTPNNEAAENIMKLNKDLIIKEKIGIETISVNDIIDNYLGKSPTILSIDIEGKDEEILESIDFDKYRPLIIIVEMIEYSTKLSVGQKNNVIIEFMEIHNYAEFAFTGINSIFIDKFKL